MNKLIQLHKQELTKLENKFVKDIKTYFKNYKDYEPVIIKNITDLNKIPYENGFYVILTDYPLIGNNCSFKHNDLIAIYRGQCSQVRNRINSHLFNENYKKNHNGKSVNYTVCLKIDEKDKGGINIDKDSYSNYNWMVVIHKMKDSNKLIREYAEKAFDELYEKPICSREKKPKMKN